jgi:hypothetical protein
MNPGTAPAHLMFSRATRQQIVDKRNRVPASQTPQDCPLSSAVQSGPPADFGRMIAQQTKKWRRVVKASGAKAQ